MFHAALVSFAERRDIIMRKKILGLALAVMLGLSGCGNEMNAPDTGAVSADTADDKQAAEENDGKVYRYPDTAGRIFWKLFE